MTLCTGSGSLPAHQYVWVDCRFIRRATAGFEPAVWFALHSHPGRVWGCHVLLECGAIYRNLPPHALAFRDNPRPDWPVTHAQRWNCYGHSFSLVRYDYLADLPVLARCGPAGEEARGRYLFTAVPLLNGFTEEPSQGKEFLFVATDEGRLTVQPTNRVLVQEASFTEPAAGWPTDLRGQTEWWSCEQPAVG